MSAKEHFTPHHALAYLYRYNKIFTVRSHMIWDYLEFAIRVTILLITK